MTDQKAGVAHNPDARRRSDLKFPIIGLGASAGGVVALKHFLENMPKDNGMAFVVILHLSPKHESMADKVLQPATGMPVTQVSEPTPLEPNHVYVISPANDLVMTDGYLRVSPAERPRGQHVAIDLFFRTLADVHQDKAVGIVLSGTGADGAVCIARIKEQGGITFAQTPEDAEYEDMPRNAIASEKIDFVLPVAEIPNKLVEWWRNAREIELPRPDPEAEPVLDTAPDARSKTEHALHEILEILAARSGHDFRHYKRATVLRRIERRMQVNLIKDLPSYREFLAAHPDEARALLGDMLIGVTNFFRDREAFEALERDVIPELFQAVYPPEQVRVWVPGCATGEEAYSVAMLLADHAETLNAPSPYQVFASDIDENAIASARAGVYPESIITDMPPTRLRQFFSKEQYRYRVNKAIRDHVLFALHNVLRDPPFSKIGLISCRNLLIYLDRDIQGRLLEMFHFALRPGGWLFLGGSESADAAPQHFEVVDKKHRIYRARTMARGTRIPTTLPLRTDSRSVRTTDGTRTTQRGFSFADVHQRVLEFYAPPSVVVDRDSNIVHTSEHAGRYLRFGAGEPTHNLVAVIEPALRADLRSTLFQAIHTNKSVEARVKVVEPGKPARFVNIVARPFRDPEANAEFVLVLFDEVEDALGPSLEPIAGQGKSAVLLNMEEELQRTRERLQASTEQYETSNEELKASNEELQALNEELRSTTEELETSKEELQSVNEELTTVNYELKTKVEELAKSNDDLHNFIGSTDIASLFVDPGLRIKRYTPRAADLFNLIAGDVGRSLLDITSRLDYPQLAEDAASAFQALRPAEREVRSIDGRWYMARVLPYRTADNRIDGAVLTFFDITHLHDAERRVSASEDKLRLAAKATHDYAIIVLNEAGRVTAWNSGAETLFGYSAEAMINQSIERLFTPEDVDANVPQTELDEAAENGHLEIARWHLTNKGDHVFCSGVLSRIDDGARGFVKIVRNTTRRELLDTAAGQHANRSSSEMRAEVASASALKDDFLAVISHELKNPLNLISVNTDLLARLPKTSASPQMDLALEMIRRAIRGQSKIIDDLLDISRIRTGKLELQMEAVDLGAIARAIVDTARADWSTATLDLSCELPEQPVVVRADRVRLEQIVWNLLSNAIKFTPEGGRVSVRISIEENLARLRVQDSGQGIEPHFLPRIFEMFGQAPNRALSGKGGLGIGLALVKQLVQRHNGRIDVQSEGIGRGSTFSIWLPLYEYDPLTAPPLPAGDIQDAGLWRGRKVLITDDATEALQTLAQLLELEGASVAIAHDGAQALALIEQARYDIVFADIGMPNMDGYELAERLRKLPNGASVPLVAITGFTRPNDVQRALHAGFDAHVGKPLSLDALTGIMRRLLNAAEGRPAEST